MKVILILILVIILFFACREILCWYWKINEHLKNQQTILEQLREINSKLDKGL